MKFRIVYKVGPNNGKTQGGTRGKAAQKFITQGPFSHVTIASMGQLESVLADTSTEAIVERITTAVLEQRLPLGAKLGEEDLCEVFGVSRTKIRQALNRLSQSKLIVLRPRRGAFVAEPTPSEARQIFEARVVIERELIARFTECATIKQLAELDRHVAAERRAISAGDVPARNRLLGAFHIRIAEFVGNDVLADILSDLVSRSSLITLLLQSSKAATCSSADHAAIVAAVRKRDRGKAVRLMLEHIAHVEQDLVPREIEPKRFDLKSALSTAMGRAGK